MRVEWSTQAQDDLAAILRYVVEKFGLNTALRVNGEIFEDVNKLSLFPLLGRVIFTDPHSGLEYRSLSMKQSCAIYIVADEVVTVVLLWNNRLDIKKLHITLSGNKS